MGTRAQRSEWSCTAGKVLIPVVQMKKRKDVTPADYKNLQAENARLQGELKREKLRADFYEEMVSFGEEFMLKSVIPALL